MIDFLSPCCSVHTEMDVGLLRDMGCLLTPKTGAVLEHAHVSIPEFTENCWGQGQH